MSFGDFCLACLHQRKMADPVLMKSFEECSPCSATSRTQGMWWFGFWACVGSYSWASSVGTNEVPVPDVDV